MDQPDVAGEQLRSAGPVVAGHVLAPPAPDADLAGDDPAGGAVALAPAPSPSRGLGRTLGVGGGRGRRCRVGEAFDLRAEQAEGRGQPVRVVGGREGDGPLAGAARASSTATAAAVGGEALTHVLE